MRLILISSFFHLFLMGCLVNCDHVPVVLWNVKGSAAPMRPVSAFEVNNDADTQELLHSTLNDKSTSMLVYVMDKLSMEDLAAESSCDSPSSSLKTLETLLGDMPHTMFPSVKDPMRQFREVTCGVKDVHAAKHSENLEKVVSSSLESACVVVVHLGNKGLPNGKQLLPKTSKKNVVGVFTAPKSSWHPPEELHRKSRSLFAVEPKHFINVTDCSVNETSSIIMYASEVTLERGSEEAGDNVSYSLIFPPTAEGICDEGNRTLILTFAGTSEIPEVVLTFNFRKLYIGAWILSSSTLKVDKEDEVDLKTPTIDVPLSFSYSCATFIMKPENATITITTALTIDGFQIQPYEVNEVFASSFDCVPFFTLPIWMGICVGILFIIILNSGIYALFNIKTMDRFDDPKGKTISVPVGTD